MQYTTEYREKETLTGSKLHYMICKVEFSNEERAIAAERGMYDSGILAPAAEPMPSTVSGMGSGCLKLFGFLIPIGLLIMLSGYVAPEHGSATPGVIILIIGTVLCAMGWMEKRQHGMLPWTERSPSAT